jgi:2'-5' RNA ligase
MEYCCMNQPSLATEPTLRLFIALDLPQIVRQELHNIQRRLHAHNRAVRWSDPAGMHLTLHFLGETPERFVAPLLAGLHAITVSPLRLRLNQVGCFPTNGSLRVVWAGLDGDLDGLASLHRTVGRVIESIGLAVDPRPFTPHITLARARTNATPTELRSLRATLVTMKTNSLEWQTERPILFRSQLTARGAIYTALG